MSTVSSPLWLSMVSCNFHVFPNFSKQSNLRGLDLSDNRITGIIPSWIWEIGLTKLNLSYNLFVELEEPYYRIRASSLDSLDLHSNYLEGEVPPLPQRASYVDYSKNNFTSTLPTGNVSESLFFLSLANNNLSGEIPTALCTRFLEVLDLSFNNLSGSIPPCLLEKSHSLRVLSFRGNNIDGILPDQFRYDCLLLTLDVSGNNLGGKLPKSIANCTYLKVFNVGGNNFDDSFPCMLPPSLHVMVLRFNRFHGELRYNKSWPNLQIMDISSNNFNGSLHSWNLSSWRAMILERDHVGSRPKHSGNDYLESVLGFYRDEVTLTVKKVELKIVKIWPDFTCIDFSCNNFEGDIPNAIGDLTSLYLLNLSNNAFSSAIPKSLGDLTELEALDISVNGLRGRIPEELTHLSFLSFLNLSYNQLVGMVPRGSQFQTFLEGSFVGNKDLCGYPLSRNCSSINPTPDTTKHGYGYGDDDDDIKWEYVLAALGYVVGLGSILWTLLCYRSFRQRYFEKADEVIEKIFNQRDRKRRHVRRRMVERRNDVRRR